jgi:hypothetical protein
MIEGCKPVAAGIRRRQGQNPNPTDPVHDRLNMEIPSDPEWANREFDDKPSATVLVMISPSLKTDAAHRHVQGFRGNGRLQDEIQV